MALEALPLATRPAEFLPRMQRRKFCDLVCEVAVVRLGPVQGGMVHPFINPRIGRHRKTGPSVSHNTNSTQRDDETRHATTEQGRKAKKHQSEHEVAFNLTDGGRRAPGQPPVPAPLQRADSCQNIRQNFQFTRQVAALLITSVAVRILLQVVLPIPYAFSRASRAAETRRPANIYCAASAISSVAIVTHSSPPTEA